MRLSALWAATWLLLAISVDALAASEVRGVRIWRAPDNTRLVFDLSGPVQHSLFILTAPDRIVVDLKGAQLAINLEHLSLANTPITSVSSAQRSPDELRLVIQMSAAVTPKSFYMAPNQQYGNRLVVDLFDANDGVKPATAPVTALPKGALKSSNYTNETVFGYKLGNELPIPECKRSNDLARLGYFYERSYDTTCFEYFPKGGVITPYDTGTVKVTFPVNEIPEGVWGIEYFAFLLNGKLEGVRFNTGGIENMNAIFAILKSKYGAPGSTDIRKVGNLHGATFDVISAKWERDNTEVDFVGAIERIDDGFVAIGTKRLRMYRESLSDKDTSKRSL